MNPSKGRHGQKGFNMTCPTLLQDNRVTGRNGPRYGFDVTFERCGKELWSRVYAIDAAEAELHVIRSSWNPIKIISVIEAK